ncbi:unnamed protein product [Rotaria sordida]|uniref:Ubiquitin-like domain-containing protein n=3 Tax=Rotaria sordida TaxID=392033 RepID=A0A814FPK7_9BILA|nr:unnamed protein product [Rotaria sordida]CAF0984908.1 unnamed protein product [Rotaria sordida]
MSLIGYSTGYIQFIPNNDDIPECNYSERSLVQLHYHDNNSYSLNAIDIENNRTEIFNLLLIDDDQYKFGLSGDEPDEIKDSNGIYRLWLNEDSRNSFHETVRAVCEILLSVELTDTSPERVDDSSIHINFNEMSKPDIPNPINSEPKDILTNICNLSKSIQQGNANEAAQMAKQLASQSIRLQGNSVTRLRNEDKFRILVQFDGDEYSVDQHGGIISVDVFPSTTVRELRAAFELTYHYSPFNQYFFVNGNLVHDNSTMRDLQVGPNSLFVLFLLEHSKKFKNNVSLFLFRLK